MAENRDPVENVANRLEKLSVGSVNGVNESLENYPTNGSGNHLEKWGFPLKDLYRMGLKFYKGKRTHLYLSFRRFNSAF